MNSIFKSSIAIAISIILFGFKNKTSLLISKPDLKVQSIVSTMVEGSLVLTITIKNIGTAKANKIFDNYIELNNSHEPSPNPNRIQTRQMAGLGIQQSKTIEIIYPASSVHANDVAVTVITDSKISRIVESNEDNNKKRVSLP